MSELSPYRRLLPPRWRPPVPFPVVVRYWDHSRAPDMLWTMPQFLDADGKVILYLAVGPAGKPAAEYLRSHVGFRGLPRGSHVHIQLGKNPEGVTVYGVPNHTAN